MRVALMANPSMRERSDFVVSHFLFGFLFEERI
jgi:hypothetical protein